MHEFVVESERQSDRFVLVPNRGFAKTLQPRSPHHSSARSFDDLNSRWNRPYPATTAGMTRPLIGITVDNVLSDIASGRYESNVAYSRAVVEAGGLSLLLPQEVELAAAYVDLCDGLLLTGGDDARTEGFGVPAHALSRCIEPR